MKNSLARGAVLALLASGLLASCATQPIAHRDPRDPWESVNRKVWAFDMAFTRKVALPVGHAYQHVTPSFVRTRIGNFMDNLEYPLVFVNDLLQAKFTPFLSDGG
ncbi:MAG: MlaA family lipoprotein, partial [Steroidobacteraceae bacterium]